ncbi:hypothetical protein [Beduinella massiliensis]|uniref:hypothetical protein n=1 Tax=Beduinella massiliensis TaxID=1852363 RepID=UPI000C83B5A0
MEQKYTRLLTMLLLALALSLASLSALAEIRVDVKEETAGNSRMSYPVVSGIEDEIVQGKINTAIETGLSLESTRLTMKRIVERGGEAEGEATLLMDTAVYQKGDVLSVAVSRRGEQADGSLGDSVTAMVFDLKTGDRIPLEALFADPQASLGAMEGIIETEIGGSLNAYMENAKITPMPRDNYSIDARGVTVYYPASQYSMVSGSAGACQFYFYELEDGLSELGKTLSAAEETADAAKGIRDAVSAGAFPNWVADVKLGEPIGTYMKEFTQLTDPDYTLESRVYLFEEPQLRGMSLETWLYAECEEEEAPLTAIRAARIDLFGIRPGISTLAECEKLLGAPDGRATLDENDAVDLMLEPGDSLFYVSGENTLEIHADQQGVVSCLILYAGKRVG